MLSHLLSTHRTLIASPPSPPSLPIGLPYGNQKQERVQLAGHKWQQMTRRTQNSSEEQQGRDRKSGLQGTPFIFIFIIIIYIKIIVSTIPPPLLEMQGGGGVLSSAPTNPTHLPNMHSTTSLTYSPLKHVKHAHLGVFHVFATSFTCPLP